MSAVFSVYSNKRSPSNVFLLISAPILITAYSKDLLEQAAFGHEIKVVCCLTTPHGQLHHQRIARREYRTRKLLFTILI